MYKRPAKRPESSVFGGEMKAKKHFITVCCQSVKLQLDGYYECKACGGPLPKMYEEYAQQGHF